MLETKQNYFQARAIDEEREWVFSFICMIMTQSRAMVFMKGIIAFAMVMNLK
jgi:hypothetical protein